MSVDGGNVTRPMYRPEPAPRKRLTMGAGAVTQSFFAKGEEQEATGYQDVMLDDAASGASSDLGFDSFDKIPRRRRPLIMVAGFLSLLVMGFLAWKAVRGPGRGSSIAVAARAMVGDETAPPPAPAPSKLTVMPSPAVVAPAAASPEAPPASVVPTEVAPSRPPKIAEPAAETENHAARSARKADSEPTADIDRPSERAITGSRTGSRPAPLRGYVWSPEANGLVPTGAAAADPAQAPASTPTPSVAPAGKFGIAPSRTTPAPVESRRAPTESAPIVE